MTQWIRICRLTTVARKMYEGRDLFALFETDRIFHLNIMAASCEYARQGLATKMVQMSLEIAVEMGFQAASIQKRAVVTRPD
jgi:hypothetical protein